MQTRLQQIAKSEHCHENTTALLDTILHHAQGDMRRAVTTLQSIHAIHGPDELDDSRTKLSSADVAEIVGVPPPAVVERLYRCISSKSFDAVRSVTEETLACGYSALLLLSAMVDTMLVTDTTLLRTEYAKAVVALKIAEAEKNISDGADEYLQLMTVMSTAFQTCLAQGKAEDE
jgi:replication factor C subunit 2/4